MTNPKRIWIAESDLPQLMHNGLVMDAPEDGAVGFVRADIVQELAALIRDAIEDENEFETEWDKCARAALAKLQEAD